MRRALALALVLGCGRTVPAARPSPRRILPTGAYRGQPAHVRVWGTSFNVYAVHHLGGGAQVDDRFRLRIGGVELSNTAWTAAQDGEQLLEADVPADLPAGVWDVEVEDAAGRTGTLPGAWTESERVPPRLVLAADVPPQVEAFVVFTAQVRVTNTGGEPAQLSSVTLDGAQLAFGDPVLLAGEVRSIAVQRAAPAGQVWWTAGAAATDTVTGQALPAASGTVALSALRPPQLTVTASPLPAAADVGQAIPVALRIRNSGEIAALAVVPSLVVPAGVTVDPLLPQDIAPGVEASYSTFLRAPAAGALPVAAGAQGVDQLTSAQVSAAAQPLGQVQVQSPAALQAAVSAPAVVYRGQGFDVVVSVTNTGDAAASGVLVAAPQAAATGLAAATTSTVAAPVTLAGHQSAQFTFGFTENGTGTGALVFSSSAAGSDANSGAQVSSPSSSSAGTTVTTPAQLAMGAVAAPAAIDRGQAFAVSVTVKNSGGATAKQVTVTPQLAATGGAHATTATAQAPVDLAPGQSATLSWSYLEDGAATGALSISAAATGADANTSAALSTSSPATTVPVQAPAALSAAWTVPASAGVGQSFAVTLKVTNAGDATATSVAPAASITGAGASLTAGPTPASATIAGGASATFSWTASASAAGNVQLSATVAGADGNTAAQLTASATSALIAIGEAATLSTDPFSGDGTTFAYLFSYQGQVYLGPNRLGTGMVRMAPDGSSPAQVNWQLEVNTDPLTAARNSAYQGTGVLCHTIGTPSCTQGTTQCGPDNESGPGVFMSGSIGATEWYGISGASKVGGARYLYLTNPNFPLAPGGFDDLAFLQIQAGQDGGTRMATAAHFFNGRLYLGFLDVGTTTPGSTAPVLDVVTRMPAQPGTIAASGTDLVNLQAVAMPAVGATGTPKNVASAAIMIDAIADFGGVLYLGNNGGLVRSTSGSPGPCTGACAEWVNVTPSAAPWANESSITVDSSVLGKLEPARRAIPGIVSFGGRLFAARNTNGGPQLWSCAPPASGQCGPGDFSLVAGSNDFTQLRDVNNVAITLLAASRAHLYVGFNNSAGIEIWRAATPPALVSDFTGHGDCVAGTAGCTPVGGSGLGNGSTRIFDGKVFTLGGQDWLYVSAGDGTTAPKVSRIVP